MRRISALFMSLTLLSILSGCKKNVTCDPGDSRAVCEQFQQCLRSDTSTEVCKMAEQDANKLDQRGKH
ncbi:MAG: hypothetical protein WA634_10140 [Silvibacterium sp.]